MYMMMPFEYVPMTEMMNEMLRPFDMEMNRGIRMDIRETKEGYELDAEIPGAKKEDIRLSMTGNDLVIAAEIGSEEKKEAHGYTHIERRHGKLSRTVNLRGIDRENIHAKYENGVLHVTLPKIAKEIPETHEIAIEGSTEAA